MEKVVLKSIAMVATALKRRERTERGKPEAIRPYSWQDARRVLEATAELWVELQKQKEQS